MLVVASVCVCPTFSTDALTVTAWQPGKLVPQALPAVTHTLPEVVPKLTVALVVPCPAATLAPAGTVHVYTVAFATGAMEYDIPDCPLHTVLAPVIPVGIVGATGATVTAKQFAGLDPQELLASTQTFPETLPKLAVMALVPWPAVMVALVGTVQL